MKVNIKQVKSSKKIPVRVRGESEKAMLKAIKLVNIANQAFADNVGRREALNDIEREYRQNRIIKDWGG